MDFLPAIIYWNTSPEIVNNFLGFLTVRWYSLLFGLSFFIGYYLFVYIAKKEKKKIEDLDDLVMYMFIATVVGARLGHVLFYDFHYYFVEHPMEIFQIWHGGLASHGAIFTIVLALFIFMKRHKGYTFIWLLDRMAWIVALAATFIRLGNFFNSEIVGLPTNGSWGVVFMQNGEDFPRIPIMLFESANYFVVFILLSYIYVSKKGRPRVGLMSAVFFTLMLLARFICEFWKGDYSEIIALGLNSGQLLSIPFFLMGLGLFYYSFKQPSAQ
ncbi:MAG: prolipoprotein diacylglyceryl transferase [Chitinophagales bacterium]|nr:prolipoprotein diacylglyceryl transferase [Chitinophagales bacterium]